MSFRKNLPYRRAVRLGQTEPLAAFHPDEVPEGARDGLLRIVHARRASKLRKRGVVLQSLGDKAYAWFEHGRSFAGRMMYREVSAAIAKAFRNGPICYNATGLTMIKAEVERVVGCRPELAAGYSLDLAINILRKEGESDAEFRARAKGTAPSFTLSIPSAGLYNVPAYEVSDPFEVYNKRDAEMFGNVVHHNLTRAPDYDKGPTPWPENPDLTIEL